MKKLYTYTIIILFIIFSCKNKEQIYNGKEYSQKIESKYNNERSVPVDSLEAIKIITNQKIQELYDLGFLRVFNSDKELDAILTKQMANYFSTENLILINDIIEDIKKSNSNYVEISDVEKINPDTTENDSIGTSKFLIKYFNKNKKYISEKHKYAKYILKKKENNFKFYFINFSENDSILNGEIK